MWDIDCKTYQGLEVLSSHTTKTTETHISNEIKNISMKKQKHVRVDEKKGTLKDFDALEKRWEISNFLRRDIMLTSRFWWLKNRISQRFAFVDSLWPKVSKIWAQLAYFFRNLSIAWYFSLILIFLSSAFLLVFLAKHTIEVRVNRGYETLLTISEGWKDFEEIRKLVNQTRFDFLLADILFQPFRLSWDHRLWSVSHAIKWWRHLSLALDHSFSLVARVEGFISESSPRDVYWVHVLERLYPHIITISESMTQAIHSYEQISWLPSQELFGKKNRLVDELQNWELYINTLISHYNTLLSLLWSDERKQYLIVFQNADEIRPTGWFMGSMAIASMFRGRVDIFDKKDVYAIEWDLKLADYERRSAPKWLSELTEFFWLRDANYFINTRDSAEAIKFFVGQAGLDIDGIIFLNQSSILRLLDISWPVYFEELKRDITKNNFSEIISLLVEAKVFHKGTLGTPKQILFDFVPVFFSHLKEQWSYAEYLSFLAHEIQNREVILWLFDEDGQNMLSELWLDGQIDFSQTQDFWYPVYTSVSWNKSDRYMQRSYSYTVSRRESCDYDISVQISSTHAMTKVHRDHIETLKNEFWIEEDFELRYIQWEWRNRQYVRYLLPLEAQVQQVQSWEVVNYGSRQGLEFFIETPLLQTSRFDFSYTLPNPDCDPYSFTHFKQPGIRKYDIDISYNGSMHRYTDITSDFTFER